MLPFKPMTASIALKIQLEDHEKHTLAHYAVMSSKSAGRQFPEPEDPTRTVFQRDRDRIIHSKAFRRLSGKTQVFLANYGDHFRDRLSHTLEVAQVARDLARNLRLNEDLCEAIALAHDLGHPPFAHYGQDTLNEIMQKFGFHFEHNEQSKRVVEKLEKQFPNFEGLNLTYEVRQGLAKHQTLYDQENKLVTGKTLEAQVVDLADEIAYHNHDLDDGIRSKLFGLRELRRLAIWKESEKFVFKKYGKKIDALVLCSRAVSHIISMMITNVIETSSKNIIRLRIRTLDDVLKQEKNLVCFSPDFQKKVAQLRQFLWDGMYQSPRVLKYMRRGQRIIKKLFWNFYKKPQLLPEHFREKIGPAAPLEIIVKDYVAGCTDQFATQLYSDHEMS
ncbi:MAG: deoxyguanosinetriphosphate triphosphohydrolase [Patescibacteria group bacterium]